jgi:hypothetical protein
VAGACTVDTTGPAIAWVNVPSTIEAGKTFTATFSLRNPSNVDPQSPNVRIGGAPGWIVNWCGFPVLATRTSGTAVDGIWSVSCAVPATAVTGSYSLFVAAQDFFGNSTMLSPAPTKGEFDLTGGNADDNANKRFEPNATFTVG